MEIDPTAVVIGLGVIDIVLEVPELPTPAKPSVQVRTRSTHPGGKGLTQAVAARLLQMPTALITPIATDEYAETLKHVLELHNINTDFVPWPRPSDPLLSPRTYVLRTPGEDYYCGFKNEHSLPLREELIRASSVAGFISKCDLVFLTFEMPPEVIRRVLMDLVASESRGLLILTASPSRDDLRLDGKLLRRVDLLVGSDTEIAQLSPPRSNPTPSAVLSRLINDGVTTAVALGTDTLVVASRHVPDLVELPYPDVTTFDTAGARDAFAVCLARQLHFSQGRVSEYDLRLASVAYCLAAGRFGEAESMPTIEEVGQKAYQFGILPPP